MEYYKGRNRFEIFSKLVSLYQFMKYLHILECLAQHLKYILQIIYFLLLIVIFYSISIYCKFHLKRRSFESARTCCSGLYRRACRLWWSTCRTHPETAGTPRTSDTARATPDQEKPAGWSDPGSDAHSPRSKKPAYFLWEHTLHYLHHV